MKVVCIYGIDYDSNIYVAQGKHPTIVDCGTGLHHEYVADEIKKIIDPTEIEQIVLTHEHYDHCGGVRQILELIGNNVKIIAHTDASDKIEKGESDFAMMLGGVMPKIPVNLKIKEGDELKIGDEKFKVIHTPGHTPGSICLYSKDSKSLFSGDTIFPNGYFGRYDFPGGDADQLKNSIEKLAKLDIENIYPGHETVVEGNGKKHMNMTLQNIKSIANYD